MPPVINPSIGHPHPVDFRLTRILDRGWGEMAFEYQWNSTSGLKGEDRLTNPDLDSCMLYEMTSYAGNEGTYQDGYFLPPSPPFMGWRFREPTDGRNAPVALGCFAASQGWAWDRHKLGGALSIPDSNIACNSAIYSIQAVQEYRFHCEICDMDAIVPGKSSGPHSIMRVFAEKDNLFIRRAEQVWRYQLEKHQSIATMDIDIKGYVDDSAHIGFGPF